MRVERESARLAAVQSEENFKERMRVECESARLAFEGKLAVEVAVEVASVNESWETKFRNLKASQPSQSRRPGKDYSGTVPADWWRYVTEWTKQAEAYFKERNKTPLQILAICQRISARSVADPQLLVGLGKRGSPSSTANAVRKRSARGFAKLDEVLGGRANAVALLRSTLSRPKDLLAVFPVDEPLMQTLRRSWVTDAFAQLQLHWSVERCLYACVRYRVPFETWYKLVETLFRRKNEDGQYKRIVIDGVRAPVPHTRYQFDKYRKAFRESWGFDYTFNGVVCKRNIMEFLAEQLAHRISEGCYVEKQVDLAQVGSIARRYVDENEIPVVISLLFDAFRLSKVTKTTAFGFAFLNALGFSANSPVNIHHFLLLEDEDSSEALWHYLKDDVLPEVNRIIEEGIIENVVITDPTTGTKSTVNVYAEWELILDQAAAHGNYGLAGCGCGHPCSKCEIERAQMMVADVQIQRHSKPRVIERILQLAHLVCGECPGCGMTIVDPKPDKDGKPTVILGETEMFLLKRGQRGNTTKVPAAVRKKHPKGSWLQIHFGVVPGFGVAFSVKLSSTRIDIMHMANRIMNAMMKMCFWKELDKYVKTYQLGLIKDKDDSKTMSKVVFDFMKTVGYSINKLPMPDKSNVCGEYLYSLLNCSFGGRDVNLNLMMVGETPVWQLLLDMILPATGRPMTADGKPNLSHENWDQVLWETYSWSTEMWGLWTWIWQIIDLKSLPENWKEQMQLIQQFGLTCGGQQFKEYAPEEEGLRWFKADAVDILSLELIRLWASKNHTFHVYPHMMYDVWTSWW